MCVVMDEVVAWTSEVLLIFVNYAFFLVFRIQSVCFQALTLLTSPAPELFQLSYSKKATISYLRIASRWLN